MIISISGSLGSGKSTAAKNLAKQLNYKHYSTGDFWRELAARRNLDVYEYNKLAEIDPSIDKEIDGFSGELGKKEDDFVIDSRLAWYFIPQSYKVQFEIDPYEGAKRIFLHSQQTNRGNEKRYENIEKTMEAIKKRDESEKQRFLSLYNADITNPNNYDLVINTTNLTPEQVVEKILDSLPEDEIRKI